MPLEPNESEDEGARLYAKPVEAQTSNGGLEKVGYSGRKLPSCPEVFLKVTSGNGAIDSGLTSDTPCFSSLLQWRTRSLGCLCLGHDNVSAA